jgi:hypothetical protein
MRSGRRAAIATVMIAMATLVAGSATGQSPSVSLQPDPSSGPASAPPSTAPVAADPVIVMTFDDPEDGWWTGRDRGERTTRTLGRIRTVLRRGPSSTWQWVKLTRPTDSIQVQANVLVDEGPGAGGPICGDAGDGERYFWGGVNEGGEWLLGRIVDGRLQVEQRGESPLPAEDQPIAGTIELTVTLVCAVDPAGGGDRVSLSVNGYPAGEMTDLSIGPYTRAGIVVAGDEAGVAVEYDDLAVWDATALGAAPSPGAPASPGAASPRAASPAPSASEGV